MIKMTDIDFNTPKHVYFCGIGGISMSGIAQMLLNKGFKVEGSDNRPSELTDELVALGAIVHIGQTSSNVTEGIEVFVYTAAIKEDNPEFAKAKELNIPMMTRAELLGLIMKTYPVSIAVSGTHGKTTTTSMISEMLMKADTDPTLSIGGVLPSIGGNVRIGNGDMFVTEACEYTNSFLSFFPRIALILNIEEDHMDFFKDINDIRNSFTKFAELLPMDGTLIINGEIDNLDQIIGDLPCNVKTFGFDDRFDYYATDIKFDEKSNATYTLHCPEGQKTVSLLVPGKHNVANSLAALCCCSACDVPLDKAISLIGKFTGTDRRFEYKGTVGEVTIIDDYAHHPTEIASTLNSAKGYKHNRLWVIFQPHTYTRTKAFLTDFAESLSIADVIVLADIYAAREKNTIGISSKDLQAELLKRGSECYYFPSFDEIENFCLEKCSPGDLLITMGAGDIVKVGESLLGL
jgi:UDP-N-acetylmuramate--alanine ligase